MKKKPIRYVTPSYSTIEFLESEIKNPKATEEEKRKDQELLKNLKSNSKR